MAIEVSIMIEGQDGLSWPRWQRIARAAEDLGFAGLYRSDHFSNPQGPYKDAIETWVSLAWLAGHTERIAFGTMVSPVSFRNPSILAWQAATIDALAGGRLRLGVGAGWQEREHSSFGFELGDVPTRMARLEEALQVLTALTRSSEPSSFDGEFFQLHDALIEVRSPRPEGTPITIGGNGPKRTLPLVAKYADEWNTIYPKLDEYPALSARLDALLAENGRAASAVKRTAMSRLMVGKSDADLAARIEPEKLADLQSRDAPVGTPDQVVQKLREMEAAGIQGVMLQLLELDDIAMLETFAAEVLPQL